MQENTDPCIQIVRSQDRSFPFRFLEVCEDMHRSASGPHFLKHLGSAQQGFRRIPRRFGHTNRLEEIQQVLLVGGHSPKAVRCRIRHQQHHRCLSAFIHILQKYASAFKGHTQFSAVLTRDVPHHGTGVVDHNHDRLIATQPQDTAHARKRQTSKSEQEKQQQQRSGQQEQRFAKLSMKRQSRFHTVKKQFR